MSSKIGSTTTITYGTLVELLADSPTTEPIGSLFIIDEGQGQGLEYSVNNSSEWFQRGQIQIDDFGNPGINIIDISNGAGIAGHRYVSVENETLPTLAGTGVALFSSKVYQVSIDSIILDTGVIPLSANNWAIRFAIDAANDAAAGISLPTVFPSGSPTEDLGQIGSFNIMPILYSHTVDGSRLIQIMLPNPIELEFSTGIDRLDFAHNLGAGVNIILGLRTSGD